MRNACEAREGVQISSKHNVRGEGLSKFAHSPVLEFSGNRSIAWLQLLHTIGRTALYFAVGCGESAVATIARRHNCRLLREHAQAPPPPAQAPAPAPPAPAPPAQVAPPAAAAAFGGGGAGAGVVEQEEENEEQQQMEQEVGHEEEKHHHQHQH